MRVALGQFKTLGHDDLQFAAQLGVSGIPLNAPDFDLPAWREVLGEAGPEKASGHWRFMDLVRLRELVEGHELRLEAIENMPDCYIDQIKAGGPDRERQIDGFCRTIENMGRAGIPVFGYNFNITKVWRTTRQALGRGGSRVTAFDLEVAERSPDVLGRRIEAEAVWELYESFAKVIVPVAERAGVRLALHIPDPPVPALGGVARVLITQDQFDRAMEVAPGPAHALDFCMGTWAEGGIEKMFAAMEHFGRQGKIAYVHFRNVIGTLPKFREAFIDEGDVDAVRAVRLLHQVGFDGFIIDDHAPAMTGDTPYHHRARAYQTGYIKGLVQAIAGRGSRSVRNGAHGSGVL